MKKILKKFLIALVVLLVIFALWFAYEFNYSKQGKKRTVVFEVKEGSSVKSIARSLEEWDLIKNRHIFLLGFRLFFPSNNLRAGEYSLELPLSSHEILKLLIEGKVILYPITIPEGLTRLEMAGHVQSEYAIAKDAFLEASGDPRPILSLDSKALNLEGYLFPETYHFPKNTTARFMVTAMVDQFSSVFDHDWRQRAKNLGFTIREIVILASLIEEETSLPEERNLVSATFHNRLRIGMKLDCDPTIIYALKLDNAYTGRLRYRDLKLDSPYNTYIYPGLPPGPICNPGKASIQAALYPADEDFLYFVSKNDGSHKFSRTFKEHQTAVNIYQKRDRNR
ncbi:MAG: endolytic transglycosylase MltG [Candidatus Aminicenantes bacterium]|nr:endolytic transglycosylase MltG [Candidatus Aminicenantes bacterium]